MNDWKDIVRKDSGWGDLEQEETGWGSDFREKLQQGQFNDIDLETLYNTDDETFTDEFKDGIACMYCDAAAEWKCKNGLSGGCSYSVNNAKGDPNDGVQVCGANSQFAMDNAEEFPEGHKSYALKSNTGHKFVNIEEYFTLDPDGGWRVPKR